MIVLVLWACVQAPTPDTGDTDIPAAAADGTVLLGDENNFFYTGTLDAPSFAMAQNTDITVSWADLVTDLRCHDLDPVVDIDNSALLIFPYLTEEEVEDGLSTDTLDQADLGGYLSQQPGDATSVSLSGYTFFGTDADIVNRYDAGSGTWLVLLTTGTEVAIGTRMLAFITPTDAGGLTETSVSDGCSILDFDADLASLTPVPMLSDGPWELDWSALTQNGQDGEFVPTRADGVMIARFAESVAELEDNFLDLEELAEDVWTYELTSGTTADLGALTGPSDPFPGFLDDGVWVLALTCSTCPNPAPLFLTIVEPG